MLVVRDGRIPYLDDNGQRKLFDIIHVGAGVYDASTRNMVNT